jgi:hypothetical protein
MTSAAFPLQDAVYQALKADAALIALIGNPSGDVRLYQDVPADPVFPYVTIGEDQANDDSVEHLDAEEIFFDLHVWSRESSWAEAKQIAAALRSILHNADLTLDYGRCVQIQHRITRSFTDADNETRHGVVTFRALTEDS